MIKIFRIKNKFTTGFTLIEMLIAISIFSLSIVASISVLGGGISNTNSAQAKIAASYLAQESIESIRNMRDSFFLNNGLVGWNDFKTELNTCTSLNPCGFDSSVSSTNTSFVFGCSSCVLYLSNGGYNYNSAVGVLSPFSRKIWADTSLPDEVTIYSTVSWGQGALLKSITIKENLLNWIE